MAERVGIFLDLVGKESIAELKAELLALENKKLRIRIEADKQLADIESRIRKITDKKNEIKFRADKSLNATLDKIAKVNNQKANFLKDYEKASKQIAKMGADAQKVQAAFKKMWGVDANFSGFGKKLSQFDTQLKSLQSRAEHIRRDTANKIAPYTRELANLRSKKGEIGQKISLDTKSINNEMAKVRQQIKAQKLEAEVNIRPNYKEFFTSVQKGLSRFGSTMMTLGNAMQRITAPINTIMRGFAYGVGYTALNKITEGLTAAFSRYDTMKMYPKMMAEFETKTYSATQSIKELEASVIGLPTGLDEIVALSQRFTLSLGDMEKGTKLAIATNRAFLASMSTETNRYQGMMQLQDLMNGKKLNSREWMSLGASMGKAISEIGKVLGYDNGAEFRRELYANKIATEDFLKALIEVGNEGGKIYELAEISKTTFSGFAANVKNAMARMGEDVLEALDKTFEKSTGRNFIQTLLGVDKNGKDMGDGIKHAIDGISKSLQNWVKANPDKIMDFLDTLKSYDWIGLGKGIAQGFGEMLGWFKKAGDFFLGSSGGAKLGRMMVKINMWGKAISLFGGVLKGLSFPLTGLATFGKWITDVGGLGKLLKFGIFAKSAGAATKTLKSVKVVKKLTNEFAPTITKWGALAKFGTATQIAASGLAIKQVLEGVAEISKVDIPPNAKWMLYRAAGVITAMTGLSSLAGKFLLSNPYAALGAGVTGLVGYGFAKGISEILSSVKPLADGLKTLQELKPIKKGSFSKVAKSITDIAPDIKDIYKALGDALPKKKPVSYADAQKGKDSVAKDVKDMLDAIKGVADIGLLVDELSKIKLSEKKIEKAKGSITKIGDVIGSLKEDIASIFGEETFHPDRGKSQGGKKTGKWTKSKYDSSSLQQYAEATGFFQEALTNLTGIVTAVSDFQKKFDKVAGDLFTKGKDGYDSTAIQEKIDGVRTFLNTAFTTNGIGAAMKGATDSLKDVDTTAIEGAFTGLVGIIKAMYKVQTTLESLSTGKSPFDAEGLNAELGKLGMAIGNLATVLTNVEFNEDSLATIDNIRRAFKKLKAVADQIDETGVGGIIKKIQGAVREIKKIDWSEMRIPAINVKVTINLTASQPIDTTAVTLAVGSAIGSVSKAVAEIPVNIEKKIPVKLVKGDITGKDTVVNAVRNAINSIQRRVDALPNEISKTVTVRVTRTTTGDIRGGGGRLAQYSTGGYVGERPLYRARGGGIFKPKGTDTVPAMLTPGEYVNKRAVVNKLGIPFFQRLNNLDIPGALRELSIRTGMSLGGGTVVNNYNNTTNNLTNNISVPMSERESRGFTIRKMGRYAGAL